MNEPLKFLRTLFSVLALATLLSACSSTESAKYSGNNYSTLARVLYVDQCIRKHRRELKEPLYACACMIDKIAEQLTFEEYEKAQTYLSAKAVAGEKGAIFRTEEAKASREQLEKAISEAESACFVK